MLALAQIDSRLKLEEAAYAATMQEYLGRELENLHRLIKAGKVDLNRLSDPSGGIFRYVDALRKRLMDIVVRVRNFGQDQVKDELIRQGAEIE